MAGKMVPTAEAVSVLSTAGFLKPFQYIGGEWRAAVSGEAYRVVSPWDGAEVAAEVAKGGREDACLAVEAAAESLVEWRSTTAKHRATILRKWYDLIMSSKENLALLMHIEMGKEISESKQEVEYGAGFLEWFAEEGRRRRGDILESNQAGQRLMTIRQPVGVVAALCPWNFPLAMATRKIGAALAAGCTAVLKPAESINTVQESPLTATAFAMLGEQAGLPKGVLNVVHGDTVALGECLSTHENVHKITFTGSTRVGRILMAAAAPTIKRVSLELGGDAPVIVLDDADVNLAVTKTAFSRFRNGGQTCICANRLLVHHTVFGEFVEGITAFARDLEAKGGYQPLIRPAAADRMKELVEDAIDHGGVLQCGGERYGYANFQPTVISFDQSATRAADARVCQEEIFGPIAVVRSMPSTQAALDVANSSKMGLAGYVFSKDTGGAAHKVAELLQVGMVGINDVAIGSEVGPFGGIKQSGYGREGSHLGLADYENVKLLAVNAPSPDLL